MSNMLEQAIIDAKSLKEAAIKNAEASLIEKYSDNIKEALTSLLEAPVDPMLPEEEDDLAEDPLAMDPMAADPMAADPMAVDPMATEEGIPEIPDVPAGYEEGEELCPCPDEDETVTVKLDKLTADLEQDQAMAPPPGMPAAPATPPAAALPPPAPATPAPLEEEINITEDQLQELIKRVTEEVNVDKDPVLSGTIGATPLDEEEWNDQETAIYRDTAFAEEKKEYEKTIKDLEESLKSSNKKIESYKNNYKKVVDVNKKFKDLITQSSKRIDEVNLSNARLLYTNRILNSVSLNERQKKSIVEAIRKAGSVSEAKTIYETLQNSAESTKSKKVPKSLREAANTSMSPFLIGRKQPKENANNAFSKRMRELAGIK